MSNPSEVFPDPLSDHTELHLASEVRVGDSERNEVVTRLREATNAGHITLSEFEARSEVAYRAETRSELVPLLEDLPTELPETRPVKVGTPGPRSSKWLVGVLGSGKQGGHFRPAPTTNAVAVGGSTRIDLTEAELLDSETVVRAFTFFGHVDVVVPDHVETDMSGVAVLGSRSHRPKAPTPAGAPRVVVKAYAVCGVVTLRNRRRLRRTTKSERSDSNDRPTLRSRIPLPQLPSGRKN